MKRDAEVMLPQIHEPGRMAQSDFTTMNELAVTIGGAPFPHMAYHLVFTYSNVEAVQVCYSKTFEALAEGFEAALWELGGGTKVDIIPLRDEPFEKAAFDRRRRLVANGAEVFVESPEDLIVRKLWSARESFSARQLADVRLLFSAVPDLDGEYLDAWIQQLGLEPVLEASREAGLDA